jgi:alkylhydroperoxidase/carboxymuconolactone decarboxylase family protein YurZ
MGDRRDVAADVYAAQFDMPAGEVPAELRRLFGPRMAEEALASMGGTAWDATLSRRERSLIVVSALIAQGGVEGRLRTHLRWAIRNGITRDELDALVSMLTVYVGFPRAGAGMAVLIEELGESEQPPVEEGRTA